MMFFLLNHESDSNLNDDQQLEQEANWAVN